jgi:hypothetical protein
MKQKRTGCAYAVESCQKLSLAVTARHRVGKPSKSPIEPDQTPIIGPAVRLFGHPALALSPSNP